MSASQHPEVAAADRVEDPRRRSTPARVYARSLVHPVFETVDERVAYIRELMATRVWTPETTGELQEALAKRWGVAEPTIRGYSRDAGRMIRELVREEAGVHALLALDTLADICRAKNSPIPGDKNAARGAAGDLLKFAGLAEPEEDKGRGATVQVIGTVITSPAMQALVGVAKKLNGANGHAAAESPDAVPAQSGDGSLVRRK